MGNWAVSDTCTELKNAEQSNSDDDEEDIPYDY